MASDIMQGFEKKKKKECHNTNPIVTRTENQKKKKLECHNSIIDALPTFQRTQMWVQVENNGRGKSRGTFPSSQHFEG
jgi:alpha-galactosidase/6-phospho-beta-glucosidase family protein